MLDHIGIRVLDYDRSRDFYRVVLAPLGYTLAMETSSGAGFRRDMIPCFWVKEGTRDASIEVADVDASRPRADPSSTGCQGPMVHIAFATRDRAMVDAFHLAALAAGARDNGAPRVRAEYHPNYYSAFVFDPDGYNIEAVCHSAPPA
jgi:catechol 2,3-dioxygenase-like lactoylglutathione lyase family enzyme